MYTKIMIKWFTRILNTKFNYIMFGGFAYTLITQV